MRRLVAGLLLLCASCQEPPPVSGRVVSLREDSAGDVRLTLALTNEGDIPTGIDCSVDVPHPGHDFTHGVTTIAPGETVEGSIRLAELKKLDEIDIADISLKCEAEDY